jgi:hypothetical protein
MMSVLDQLDQLEREVRYNAPPDAGQPPFRYVPGRLPVLISAPHGAAHRRDGRYKDEDEYTAAFARLLAERTGAHVIYAWAQSESDPNWDRHSPYKDALREAVATAGIRAVIDIHGMANRHKIGIAVGTMRGRSCPEPVAERITTTLEAQGYRPTTAREARDFSHLQWDRYVMDHARFTGGLTSHTVTRFASEELRIVSVQFELCSSLRIVRRLSPGKQPADFSGDPAAIAHTLASFERIVRELGERDTATAALS